MHTIAVVAANQSVGASTLVAWLAACARAGSDAPVVVLDASDDQALLDWARTERPSDMIAAGWDASCTAASVRALSDEGVETVLVDAKLGSDQSRDVEILDASDLVVVAVQPQGDGLDRVGEVLDLVEEAAVPFLFVVNQATDDEEMTAATVVSLAQHGTVSPVILPRYPECPVPTDEVLAEGPEAVPIAEDAARLWDYLYGRVRPVGSAADEGEDVTDAHDAAAHYDRPATFVVPEMVYPCHVIDITEHGLVFTSEQEVPPGARLRMNLPYVGQIDCEIANAASGRMNAHFVIDDARRAELMGQVAMLVDYGRDQQGARHA